MSRKHFTTHAGLERQIERARQIRAETASALLLDGLTSAIRMLGRILTRITTVLPRRA